jgi:uncharacterized protein (TIGR02246 family)
MKTSKYMKAVAAALAIIAPQAIAQHEGHAAAGDSAAVAAVVTKYHDALAAGDSAGALALLADDAVILEAGGVETRAEYRSHHLPNDIKASMTNPGKRSAVHVRILGDVAWTTSTSTSQREVNGTQVTSSLAELMVLVKTSGSWKISAIHWSSGRRQP